MEYKELNLKIRIHLQYDLNMFQYYIYVHILKAKYYNTIIGFNLLRTPIMLDLILNE